MIAKFTGVIQTETTSDEATIHFLGADGKKYSATLTPEAVSQTQAALLIVATRLRQAHPDGQHGMLLQTRGFQPFWSSDGSGLVCVLEDGVEFALHLDQRARDGLRACIDQLDRLIPGKDVH